jgi:hypothetical protein
MTLVFLKNDPSGKQIVKKTASAFDPREEHRVQ